MQGRTAAVEALITIDPPRPWAAMVRAAARQTRKVPVRFTSTCRCHSRRSWFSTEPARPYPALATQMSSWSPTTSPNSRSTSPGSV
ncbi:Uncharacterised protein [Mycobacteroides abscessus subsp. abscessus]|nr:Uncharacterised protein [Mycobacteroides abscessus subsp. abscessus]